MALNIRNYITLGTNRKKFAHVFSATIKYNKKPDIFKTIFNWIQACPPSPEFLEVFPKPNGHVLATQGVSRV